MRTLTYVAYTGDNSHVLAVLSLSILRHISRGCSTLSRSIKNRWIQAGDMSSPRVYFTATYLSVSGYVLIAGGTADYNNALFTVDIYDPATGCCSIFTMTSPRMKHTAAYFNNSDTVILIGGVVQGSNLILQSELISTIRAQPHVSMVQPRYFHEVAIVGYSNILIVAGQTFGGPVIPLEIYLSSAPMFQLLQALPSLQMSFEGHSVTTLGTSDTVLIFGGYSGTGYFRVGLIDNMTNTISTNQEQNTVGIIGDRAHHQATYIPNIDAVLITGGDNGLQTFTTCYLYYAANRTFNATGSMQQQRSFHTAVLLSNGSVLIIGGAVSVSNNQPFNPTNLVERYDYTTQSFTTVTPLNVARYRHKAVVLHNTTDVFVFGGIGVGNNALSSVEYISF